MATGQVCCTLLKVTVTHKCAVCLAALIKTCGSWQWVSQPNCVSSNLPEIDVNADKYPVSCIYPWCLLTILAWKLWKGLTKH